MDQKTLLIQYLISWRSDPILFIKQVLKAKPTAQQLDIIDNFIKYRFIAVRSGNKIGKTTVVAWLILWFMCCWRDARVPCTSPSENQLKKGIWNEVGKWYRKLPDFFKQEFYLTAEALTNKTNGTSWQAYIKTATKENPEVLSGAHSDNIFVVMDEGSAIDGDIINNILPLLGSVNAYCIIIGNPMRASGYYFDLFHGKPSIFRKLLKYSSEDSILMSKELIAAWEQSYGRESSYFKVHVLGDFPDSDEDTLIPLWAVDDAKARIIDAGEYKDADIVWGVDVGLDHDVSVIVKRQGRKVLDIKKYKQVKDTVKLCGLIKEEYINDSNKGLKPVEIRIDSIGIGRGSLDILRDWELPIKGINVGEAPQEKGRFANMKAELWYLCRDWFVQECPYIPDDGDLIIDLLSATYQTNSSGKIKMESKDLVKKRIGRSPDTGDALILTFKKGPSYDYQIFTGS
jgi:hypothetical protein